MILIPKRSDVALSTYSKTNLRYYRWRFPKKSSFAWILPRFSTANATSTLKLSSFLSTATVKSKNRVIRCFVKESGIFKGQQPAIDLRSIQIVQMTFTRFLSRTPVDNFVTHERDTRKDKFDRCYVDVKTRRSTALLCKLLPFLINFILVVDNRWK